MPTGWRIVPADQARRAFDGEGARLYGGRWNSPGTAMIYASAHQSLAALEVRVHIDKTTLRKRYKLFTFHFDDRLIQTFPPRNLPKNWQHEPPPPSLQRRGDDWTKSARSAILAVPSVIIPSELNYLLNPNHPNFRKIKIDPPTDFTFDPRLFA